MAIAETTNKPPSKLRITLTWLMMLGIIFFWVFFWLWRNHQHRDSLPEPPSNFAHSVISLITGWVFLGAGVLAYLATIFSGCFSFNFQEPVWPGVKTRVFFVNIIVPLLLALGIGFLTSAFTSPILERMGMDQQMANMLPVMLMVGGLQVVQLWVLIWAPLEKHLITKRLVARGLALEQIQRGVFVGMSNPASGITKRFCAIEEDLGALWVGPEQLIYWGDSEGLCITRDQLAQVERAADKRSSTMLGGIMHIILHVQQPDGTVRKIRLHTEGHWTMGRKKRAMDSLAVTITQWHGRTG